MLQDSLTGSALTRLGIGAIVDELEVGDENGENAIEHDRIVGIPQGWRLNRGNQNSRAQGCREDT